MRARPCHTAAPHSACCALRRDVKGGERTQGVVLALEAAPSAMADEARAFVAGTRDVREARAQNGDLRPLCPDGSYIVLRPVPGRAHFASNAGDRNALMIYESAIRLGAQVFCEASGRSPSSSS